MPKVYNLREPYPPDAVYVGRPSKWGNPYRTPPLPREKAVQLFRASLTPEFIEQIKQELRGKDLVCFCSPKLCHADILLEIANGTS